jgi:chromosome segregation ATPase
MQETNQTLPSIKSRNDLPSSPGSIRNKINDINDNPFKIPNDDRIFKLKEEEKLKKQDIRKRNLEQPIWEKTNNESLSRTNRLKDLLGDDNQLNNLSNAMKNINDDNIKIIAPRNQEKENMTEFVGKKREMFLVQMSLDTKREEIRKLEEKAQMKEEALQRSEQMLEEDAMRFDAFLKENDKKAHDAIKKAEEETKKKQEKTQEIKKYTQQIQSLNSEMSKHKEALEDCLRYKNFLD